MGQTKLSAKYFAHFASLCPIIKLKRRISFSWLLRRISVKFILGISGIICAYYDFASQNHDEWTLHVISKNLFSERHLTLHRSWIDGLNLASDLYCWKLPVLILLTKYFQHVARSKSVLYAICNLKFKSLQFGYDNFLMILFCFRFCSRRKNASISQPKRTLIEPDQK